MGQKQKPGKGGTKEKCGRYRAANRRLKNKLRRVARSNGPAAAATYARDYQGRNG